MNIENLKFDENGLIPVVVQDFHTKQVLTLAYMNAESLNISMKEKQTCFYSRSRKKLWRKGEESGHTQKIVSIISDCDGDSLVIYVVPNGPACHTGDVTCFNESIFKNKDIQPSFGITELFNLITSRKREMPQDSYTTYLFEKGQDKILKKVGEETTEVVIATKNNDKEELKNELCDLLFHVSVLMSEKGLQPNDVLQVLSERHNKGEAIN